ncbi:MAG: GH92 family glycosyl hydrolase, partial [Bacteroidales bacterium]|nr:GH92 family glycosyl hydrolase [Bacteroidales bacterium]
YHCFTSPYEFSDVDGRYRGQDGKIHKSDGHKVYTVFSLWDTYRALHPLLNLIDRKRSNDFLNTFLLAYQQGGQLPMWELSAYETWCMIGYHAVPVILDASRKGIGDFDKKAMLEAMVASAELPKLGRPEFEKFEYIPADVEHESVSKTLEYCFDDWCIAQYAKDLGANDIYDRFIRRSEFYKNIVDENGFMHPKSNGGFILPFAPGEVNNHFTEANSWQYSTYVPHDFANYVRMAGGKKHVAAMLDSLFFGTTQMSGRQQADLTGIMGQYAHGNEPGHHAPYMYNYVDQPSRTQQVVRQLMREQYKDRPDGLCGNEDCGQMSAWYVMSAMGFYAVAPGSNLYDLGSPIFDEVKIHLENGNVFTIICENQGPKNVYVESMTRNGAPFFEQRINYSMINDGDTFVFEMSEKVPSFSRLENRKEIVEKPLLTVVPSVSPNDVVFRGKQKITLHSPNNDPIYYSTSADNFKGVHLYTKPFTIKESTTVKTYAVNAVTGKSAEVTAVFHKFVLDKSVTINSKYNPQYTAGGDEGIIDGLRGNVNWRLGGWQGYQSQDFEAVVDLKSVKNIHKVSAGFLEDIRAWIWYPTGMSVEVSEDGKTFVPFGDMKNQGPTDDYTVKVRDFVVKGSAKARYVRVRAYNFGQLPEWHLGAGGDAFIFVDEILVE